MSHVTDVKDTPQEVIDVWHNADGPAGIRLRQAVRDEWPKLGKLLDACPPSDILAAAKDFETSLAARGKVKEAAAKSPFIQVRRGTIFWTSVLASVVGVVTYSLLEALF